MKANEKNTFDQDVEIDIDKVGDKIVGGTFIPYTITTPANLETSFATIRERTVDVPIQEELIVELYKK